MFDRFTDRSRMIMGLARQHAQELKHDYVGTEHLLLGMIDESKGLACTILREQKKLVTEAVLGGQAPSETTAKDLVERAWGVIASAGGGDWKRETKEWGDAAAKWRDDYHAWIKARGKEAPEPRQGAGGTSGGAIKVTASSGAPPSQETALHRTAAFLKRMTDIGGTAAIDKATIDTLLRTVGDASESAPPEVRGAIILSAVMLMGPTPSLPPEALTRAREILAKFMDDTLGGKT
jgi:hypothetical protein